MDGAPNSFSNPEAGWIEFLTGLHPLLFLFGLGVGYVIRSQKARRRLRKLSTEGSNASSAAKVIPLQARHTRRGSRTQRGARQEALCGNVGAASQPRPPRGKSEPSQYSYFKRDSVSPSTTHDPGKLGQSTQVLPAAIRERVTCPAVPHGPCMWCQGDAGHRGKGKNQ